MSALNFFEQFASISLSEEIKTNGSTKAKKAVKNEEKPKKMTQKKFVHTKNVLMTTGQYKGHSAFVYEFYGPKVVIEITETGYVFANIYGNKNMGDKIMTTYGESVIVDKIDKMYAVNIKTKNAENVANIQEIRLFEKDCMRVVFVNENSIKKLAQIVRASGNKYEVAVLDLIYKNNFDENDILLQLSEIIKKREYVKTFEKKIFNKVGMEYFMILREDSAGKFGKFSRMISEQYSVEYKTQISVLKTFVEFDKKNQSRVIVKKGVYKNKTGKLVNMEDSHVKVELQTIGKKIVKHTVKGGVEKKITLDNIFHTDLLLMNGKYFQVSNIIGDTFRGYQMGSSEQIDINESDITMFMPGFEILSDDSTEESDEQDIQTNDDLDFIFETTTTNENEESVDYEDETEQNEYENGGDEVENMEIEYNEVEMKESYKDIERTGYMQRVLSKDEKDILKYIEKLFNIIGYPDDLVNKYNIVEKALEAINKMKSDLERLNITEWKSSDIKYVIACLSLYEILKMGTNISKLTFGGYISRLFDIGYFTKSNISGSMFMLHLDKSDIKTCLDIICIKKTEVKKLYKSGNYLDIVKIMMDNCSSILQEWYGKVVFGYKETEIEYIPVCKPNYVKEYPKYYVTAKELISGNEIPATANKVIWNPETLTMINKVKMSLNKKMSKESNDSVKNIYKFVIENIDNTPFVLEKYNNSSDKNEILKCKELKRTFDMFIIKAKSYFEEVSKEKQEKQQLINNENERVNKKRKEISLERGDDLINTFDDLHMKENKALKRIRA